MSGLMGPIEPEFRYVPQHHPYMPPGYVYFDDPVVPQSPVMFVQSERLVHHYQYTEKIVYRDRRRLPVGMAWAIFGLFAIITVVSLVMMVIKS